MSVSDSTQDPAATRRAGMCTTHNDLAWLYDDGSVQCMYARVVESSFLGCVVAPFTAEAERDALYRVLAALIAGWDALPYNWSVVIRCEDDARRLLAETGPT